MYIDPVSVRGVETVELGFGDIGQFMEQKLHLLSDFLCCYVLVTMT